MTFDFNALIDAIIHEESRGDPLAVSPKGASGLMQVMPDTARQPGFGVKPMDWDRRFDAAENRRFGEDYMGAMLDSFGGDVEGALMAYNAGPGRARSILAGDRPMPKETKNYVRDILARLAGPQLAERAAPAAAALRPAPMGIEAMMARAPGRPMNLVGNAGSGGAKAGGAGGAGGPISRQDPRGDQRRSSNPFAGHY